MKELLPIGSIVILKGGKKKVMIVGLKQNDVDDKNKEYDYLGFLYPEGHIGKNFQYLFNHENIEEVFFRGYEDEEREAFIEKLDEYYKQKGNA
ncbi:MAG: DUF4176 domain-containing protein [Ruminiclostridium sp.]|nr:DUF4176 domain-containing protein [Ruminiclostridium sp.]